MRQSDQKNLYVKMRQENGNFPINEYFYIQKKSISSLLIENKIIVIHIASIVQFYFAFSNSPGQ
jgi:hypothetical protein